MIFYFSGTGNSLQAAKCISEHNNEKLISIAEAVHNNADCCEYTLVDNEAIGFVYPIYAWGPPKIVIQFIEKLKLNNYRNNYVFSVATCGDNIGNAMKLLNTYLMKKSIKLDSGFSIRMPNNYVIMGDVDSKEVENQKLLAAEKTLLHINKIIEEKRKGIFEVVKGFMPGVLTSVINPLFNKKAIDPSKFYAKDSCTSCGICEKICNCRNIKVSDKPQWGEHCTQCLGCLHLCPAKAIQYGKGTESKGRYKNPKVDIREYYLSME
jgi:flavodoxin/NAD-dependent dihydropyrimidine dehydrogenase PreA subunit